MERNRQGLLPSIVLVAAIILSACSAPAPAPTTAPSKPQAPAAAPAEKAAAPGGPIVIGQITQLTGGQAITGDWWRAGVQMAVEEWNAKGGVKGSKIELAVEDDASTTTGAVNAFNKLVTEKKPLGIIGSTYTNSIMAMEPAARKAAIPVLTGASGDPVTAVGNPYFFRIRTNDNVGAKIAVEYAVKELGVKKPGILHVAGDFGVAGATALKKELTDLGVQVLAVESYNPDDKDITAQLLNLQRAGVDTVFAFSFTVDAAMVMTAVYQRGDKFKFIGNNTYGAPDAINLAKEAANSKYTTLGWIPSDDPVVQEWIKNLAKYSKFPANDNNSIAYDGTNILLKAIEAAGTDTEAIRKALQDTRGYKGIAGEYSFDSKREGLRQVYFSQIQNGQPKLIKLVKGEFKP
ncbi:MAG: ABC transporter substrate-binding protein [Chloroflexi bacterium]|nr:ABC transporter substrate-binding protein [Chloroflexota bacterium]